MWLKRETERIFVANRQERDGKECFDVLSILHDEDFLELFGVQAPQELTDQWQRFKIELIGWTGGMGSAGS